MLTPGDSEREPPSTDPKSVTKSDGSVLLSVQLSPEAWQALQRIAREQSKAIPLAVRDVIAVADAVHEVLSTGGRIYARGPSGKRYQLVLSWFKPSATSGVTGWRAPWRK